LIKWLLLLALVPTVALAASPQLAWTDKAEATNGTLVSPTISGAAVFTGTVTASALWAYPTDPAFGAKCDGTTDDSTALAAWFAYLVANGVEGRLPPGTCVANTAQTWNMSSRTSGIRIRGTSQGSSVLDLRGVSSGTPLLMTGSGTALFYSHFSDFTVLTNIAGPGVALGNSSLTDAFNSFTFTQIEFKNVANNSAAVALQINGVYNSDFQTVTTNTGGGSTSGTGLGTSLELQFSAFNRFMGSFSSAAIGIYLTNNYNYANVFTSVDVENVNTAVQIDSANASRNTWVGGTFVAETDLNTTAGVTNVFINPNLSLYSGGARTAGTTGMFLEQFGAVGVTTPSMPASGTAYTNATGRIMSVNILNGTVSAIQIGGTTVATATNSTVILQPNQTITLTYSATPGWVWLPVL
jgi:hypothetical protein